MTKMLLDRCEQFELTRCIGYVDVLDATLREPNGRATAPARPDA
jgi:hypothetical protein